MISGQARTILKTTSGKLRHYAIRDALLTHDLAVVFDSKPSRRSEKTTEEAPSIFARLHRLVTLDGPTDDDDSDDAPLGIIARFHRFVSRDETDDHDGSRRDVDIVLHVEEPEAALQDDDRVGHPDPAGNEKNVDSQEQVVAVLLESIRLVTVAAVDKDIDPQRTSVAELGMTSMDVARLQDQLRRSLSVDVPMETLMTNNLSIVDLAGEILKLKRGNDPEDDAIARIVPLLEQKHDHHPPMNPVVVGGLQIMGVVVVCLLIGTALLPAYHYGVFVQWKPMRIPGTTKTVLVRRNNPPWSHIKVAGTSNVYAYGLLVPLCIPIFMVALAVVTVITKWVVVGRYRGGTTHRGTVYFLRWWFVDRVVDQFDLWCGVFIHGTVLMNGFCSLCGATVSGTARINTLPREFDLIFIGDGAGVHGRIYARIFEPHGRLHFAPVVIENDAEIKSTAIVMPATHIEPGAILDHGAATMPGMRLETNHLYDSSPARRVGNIHGVVAETTTTTTTTSWQWLEEMAKVMVLVGYLYGIMLTTNILVEFVFQLVDWSTWWGCRYRELAYYTLAYFTAMVVTGGMIICLKWMLLGRRRSGDETESTSMWRLRCWVVEWPWYRIVGGLGSVVWQVNGVMTLLLMKAVGVRIGWSTYPVSTSFFSPVEADLIEVGPRTVLSFFGLSCQSADGTWKPIRIGSDAQIGYGAYIKAGAVIKDYAVVGHETVVPEGTVVDAKSTYFASASFSSSESKSLNNHATDDDDDDGIRRFQQWVGPLLQSGLRAVTLALLGFGALIPPYELGVAIFYGWRQANFCSSNFYETGFQIVRGGEKIRLWRPPIDRSVAVLLVGLLGLLSLVSITVVFRVWQWIILRDWQHDTMHRRKLFWFAYMTYQEPICVINFYMMALLRGSPLANLYVRFFGADVAPTAFINTTFIMDAPLVTIGAGAVIDDLAFMTGHVFQHRRLCFKPMTIRPDAVLHPASIAWADDIVPENCILGPKAQLGFGHNSIQLPSTYLQGCPARDYSFLYRRAFDDDDERTTR